jgi:hypothetical protein
MFKGKEKKLILAKKTSQYTNTNSFSQFLYRYITIRWVKLDWMLLNQSDVQTTKHMQGIYVMFRHVYFRKIYEYLTNKHICNLLPHNLHK